MKFRQTTLALVLFLTFGSLVNLQAQKTYAVEVGAFEKKVDLNYFYKLPEADVYEVLDVNDIYRYWIDCKDKTAAEILRQGAINQGFVNARLIDFKVMEEHCKATCGYTPPPVTNRRDDFKLRDQDYKIPTNEDFEKDDPQPENIDLGNPNFFDLNKDKIDHIFFDYKSPDLRKKSKEELDKIASVLIQYPKFTVKIYAHTDANGSDAYNYKLSEARARITHKYLNFRDIGDSRISNGPFGERRPIALNALADGSDTPAGRQLNRRVELVICDENGKELDLIKPIVVPSDLKINK